MLIFFSNQKNIMYFYPVMLSEDPMGHTQSTNDKVLRSLLNELLGIYVSCVEHSAEHTPRA